MAPTLFTFPVLKAPVRRLLGGSSGSPNGPTTAIRYDPQSGEQRFLAGHENKIKLLANSQIKGRRVCGVRVEWQQGLLLCCGCPLSLPLFLSLSFDYLISQDMAGQMINKFSLCKLIRTAAAAEYSFFTLSVPDTTNTHPSHSPPSFLVYTPSLSVCVSQSS